MTDTLERCATEGALAERVLLQHAGLAAPTVQVSAAKLHVLALAPIKQRLGEKWPRLSELVHKLFEASIARAQGPGDSFVQLDELSYAAIFRGLTVTETNTVCVAIAREVCMALFGDNVDAVAVRSVVAGLELNEPVEMASCGPLIARRVEEHGTETVVSRSIESDPPETCVTQSQLSPPQTPLARIEAAQETLARFGMKLGLFPIWDLRKEACNALYLAFYNRSITRFETMGGAANGRLEGEQLVEAELALLDAAEAYALRAREAQQVCAVGVGASYETLSCFKSRIRYLTALQKLALPASTPLMLKLAQIPTGTPQQRIGELAAMLQRPQVKLLLEYQQVGDIAHFDFRVSAVGIGAEMPRAVAADETARLIRRAQEVAGQDRLFLFMDRIDDAEAQALAAACQVRFAVGAAFGNTCLSGLEAVPRFPVPMR